MLTDVNKFPGGIEVRVLLRPEDIQEGLRKIINGIDLKNVSDAEQLVVAVMKYLKMDVNPITK